MNTLQKRILQSWIKQARSAIAQGQSRSDFILHAHRFHRSMALRAYNMAQMEQRRAAQEADHAKADLFADHAQQAKADLPESAILAWRREYGYLPPGMF